MKKIILILGLLLTMLNTSNVYGLNGSYISSDFGKVYYSTRCKQTDTQKKIFQMGFKAINGSLKKFKNNLFPIGDAESTIIKEMKIATQNRSSFDTLLKFADKWVANENTNNNSTLSLKDKAYSPRGYLIFYGGSKNFGALKSVGASTNLSLIIVPNCQTVWNKKTGEIIQEDIIDIDFKLAINPALGGGKKKGMSIAQSRFGVGFIFDPNHNLAKASDFLGAGFATSRANILGNLAIAGKYMKAGTIINTKLNYFPFLMVGKAAGVGAAQVTNWGGVSFLDIASFTNIFIKLAESEITKINKETNKSFKASLKTLKKQENSQDDEKDINIK